MHPCQYPDEEHKVRFDRMKPKGICGLAEDGHEVYVDWCSQNRPQLGEVWWCQLLKREKEDNHYYFALPTYRVDSECKTESKQPLPEAEEQTQSTADSPEGESVDVIGDDGSEEQFVPEQSGFVAIGDDMIYSPRLTAARYSVYRNFTGDRLELIPDEEGDVECVRNSIALASLDDILGCETPVRLAHKWSDDRILLSLQQ